MWRFSAEEIAARQVLPRTTTSRVIRCVITRYYLLATVVKSTTMTLLRSIAQLVYRNQTRYRAASADSSSCLT